MPAGHMISRAAGISSFAGHLLRPGVAPPPDRGVLPEVSSELVILLSTSVRMSATGCESSAGSVLVWSPSSRSQISLPCCGAVRPGPGVIIEASGVAAESGRGKLHLSSRTPTVSTFADSWMNDVQDDRRFQRIQWDTVVSVPLVTLDELISRYGEPQFCKIDVEGFEHEVLTGSQSSDPGAVLRIHSRRHRSGHRVRGAHQCPG